MKYNIVLPIVAIIALFSAATFAKTLQCICINYDECNSDYTQTGTSSNYHELQTYEEGTQRPSCSNAIDVCCDLSKGNSDNTNNYFYNYSTTAKPTTKKWSCGRNIGSDANFDSNAGAEAGEFPWVVAVLQKDYQNLPTIYHCQGSLIHEKVVLTSAMEVYNVGTKNLIVRIGARNWQAKSGASQDLKVSSIHIHPNFDVESYINNYALLILDETVNANSNVNSICLPNSKDDYEPLDCTEAGWGGDRTEVNRRGGSVLKKSKLSVIDREKCENSFAKAYDTDYYRIHSSVLCAGDGNYASSCTGSGGSPVMCRLKRNRRRYVQAGISSIAVCGESGKPGLYADVSEGLAWINRLMKSRGFDAGFYSA